LTFAYIAVIIVSEITNTTTTLTERDTMQKNYYLIAIKAPDIEPIVKALASEDMRTIGNQVAWLIRQEYDRRHGSSLQVAPRVSERGLKRDHQHGQTGKE